MVTVRLCGGTGNQLWQRAFGYALEALGNEVQFDRSYYDTCDSRAYTLDRFNIEAPFGPRRGREISEGSLRYHPELLKKYDEDVTLAGYWQCPKYLEGLEDKVRSVFTLKRYPSEKTLSVARRIKSTGYPVSLHVRRTDTLSPRGIAHHGLVPADYYERAIDYITARVDSPHFFVFSDEIAWCKKYLPDLRDVLWTFVDHNTPGVTVLPDNEVRKTDSGSEHEDLWLMSQCKHAITANSSFAWWGAWLIQNPQKICISPNQWFVGKNNEMSKDMISWIRI